MNATLVVIFNIIMLFLCNVACSQESKDHRINAIYIELTTTEPAYAINYDRIFVSRKNLSFSYRIGFSISKESIYLPVGINLITGKKSSHAEFSLTAAPYIKGHNTFPGNLENSDTYLYLIPGFGYRYQSKNGGPFFKVVASPVIQLDPPSKGFWNMQPRFYNSMFFSVGYSF